ncbi:MAG: CopG family transcriptional regulator [Xanthobacteraceae bacterium]|nr:CopG family transcriptional regulator [Xanthobacteraceae bacterium]
MANHKRTEPIVRVTVGLDLSDHERLSSLASDARVSLAWMLRRAAREFLEQQGSGDGAKPSISIDRSRPTKMKLKKRAKNS